MARRPARRCTIHESHAPTAVTGRRVLVVAGRAELVARLTYLAASDGHSVTTACSGHQALAELRRAYFDLLVLGPPLPDFDCSALLRRARKGDWAAQLENPVNLAIGAFVLLDGAEITITSSSALAGATERIALLAAGADDVLAGPFSDRELQLRMAAILRRVLPRALAARQPALQIGPLRVDVAARLAMVNEQRQALTATEFRLLHQLAVCADGLETRATLVQSLRRAPSTRSGRVLSDHLARLRRKLQPVGLTIDSVRGAGVRLRLA